jgi:hypothetical protein
MFNYVAYTFFLILPMMLDIILTWCLFSCKARVGMEVPFELLGTIYHQVIISA